MAPGSTSPGPRGRSPRRTSDSRNGTDEPRAPARELSPFSARRALTLQLQQGHAAGAVQAGRQTRSRSRDRDPRTPKEPAIKKEERPRSRSRDRRPRDVPKKSPERRSVARDRSRDSKAPSLKETVPASRRGRETSGSPEPYRPSRERSKERRRERSRDRRRDRSRDKHRDRSRSKDRKRDRSRDKKREGSRERKRDRSRDRYRDRSPRDKNRRRGRSADNKRDRSRSRSPLPYRPSKRRTRSPSPPRRRRHSSRSPSPHKRRKRSPSASPHARSRNPLPDQQISFRGLDSSTQPPTKHGGAPPDREKPNFKPTGLLAKEANKVEGTKISLKYHEPPEARKPPPSQPWRLFIFKGADTLANLELSAQSCWLLGRAREVADIPLEHPSCSSQHAAIQFRYIQKTVEDEYGVRQKKGRVRPYVIDLESSNGTELNGERIEGGRYFELRDKDILSFGASEREYMVMLPPREE